MLTHPRGDMMLVEAVKGLPLAQADKIYIVGLREHEQRFGLRRFLTTQFEALGVGDRLEILLLDESTRNQPETIARAIELAEIRGPIYCKDSDNFFEDTLTPENVVSCFDLHDLERVNARNKSYVEVNGDGHLTNIVEKRIINSTFCAGGYSFDDAERFLAYFRRLGHSPELYVSHLIYAMLLDGIVFRRRFVSGYIDWGTVREWDSYKRQFSTLFIDLDGTLVINSGRYSQPGWGETDGIPENIAAINALYDTGKVQIVIITARDPSYRDITVAQLKRVGVKYHQIIDGLVHGRRIVINDYARSNPYRSCDAVNIARNSADLHDMLEASLGLSIDAPRSSPAPTSENLVGTDGDHEEEQTEPSR
jgi:hypothetical protein